MRIGWARALAFFGALHAPATAALGCADDAMIVFDGSGSMAQAGRNHVETPRIVEARRAVARAIPQIAETRRLGLLIYGPGGPDACTGIDLRFAPRPDAARAIITAVRALEPRGETALTDAVAQAAAVLRTSSGGGTVVLVTDGQESCGGAPCALADVLATQGIVVHVIGFKVRGPFFAWDNMAGSSHRPADSTARCLADRTGGHYVRTETADDLVAAFHKTLGCNALF